LRFCESRTAKTKAIRFYIYKRKDFCNAGKAGIAQADLREQPQIIYIEERRRKKKEARTAELARKSELGNREEWEAALQEYEEEQQQQKRETSTHKRKQERGFCLYIEEEKWPKGGEANGRMWNK